MPDKIRGALVCFCIAAICGVIALSTDASAPDYGADPLSYRVHGLATGIASLTILLGLALLAVWVAKDLRRRD